MNNNSQKLYLFGDSICFGQLVNAHKTWAVNLSLELNKLYNFPEHFVIQNAGVNGNTTRQALLRMHYDVISHRPNFLMIQFVHSRFLYYLKHRTVFQHKHLSFQGLPAEY